jgi:pentatricopeptide repeat protein
MATRLLLFTLTVLVLAGTCARAQTADGSPFVIVEQDYERARQEVRESGKLLFIDFYTDWCGPCKQLEKYVFQNDSLQRLLTDEVVLLRYDAENDTIFHLSKKHHVNSYPTGLILNTDGRVVNRIYGFAGEDATTLGTSVLTFIDESKEKNARNEIMLGYSADIDPTIYPDFYTDYVNRTDTDIDAAEINAYLNSAEDPLSEPYFATLLYFANMVSEEVSDRAVTNKDEYIRRYGTTDVETMLYFFVNGRFRRAMEYSDRGPYDAAVAFAERSLSQEWLDDILPSFERDYLQAQGQWEEVFSLYREMKEKGEMSNGYVNHFCWQVYEDCDDQSVVESCVEWMKEVVEEEPAFDYLDTYAFLLYKSGDMDTARQVARRAIAVGKEEDRKTAGLEKMIAKIDAPKD